MRLFLYTCCFAVVAAITPALAQDATDAPATAVDAVAPLPATALPPSRVGRVSLAAGNVDLRIPGAAGWVDAELNQPVFAGEALRTDPKTRAEIEIGASTIGLSNSTGIEIAGLSDDLTRIALSRGRIHLHLRQIGDNETIEIDFPQGGVWLRAPGRYDIDAGGGDQRARVAAFDGAAHFVGASGDIHIAGGHMAVLSGSDPATATIEETEADDFVAWCRGRDYDETRLAARYFVASDMTGFVDLDAAGIWKIDPDYGRVWFPSEPDWAPYRFGHWSWLAPWGWTWIDDQRWGFAPSHYGRWALIHEHWAWLPGSFVERPAYAPAVVAFLGTPGVGLSSEDGATIAWFPLAPGEAYWPSDSRDVDYVRRLNRGNIQDIETIELQADSDSPLESFHEDFANRQFATVVPRSVFINARPIAPARVTLPERRLQNAPVLMASPQIAPASAQRIARIATSAVSPPPARATIGLARKGGAKLVRAVSVQPRSHAQPVLIRGAHLHAPSYAGQSRGRQAIVLRIAHTSRSAAAAKGLRR